jgi:hypothetical protein
VEPANRRALVQRKFREKRRRVPVLKREVACRLEARGSQGTIIDESFEFALDQVTALALYDSRCLMPGTEA